MKTPAFQLYTGDWKKDPELSLCSPATRGIWIDLICSMHDNDRRGMVTGTVRELARLSRCDSTEMETAIDELGKHQAAEVVRADNGLVTLINRRMFDEYNERKATQLRQQKHRDRSRYTAGRAVVTQKVTPLSPQYNAVSSSSSSVPLSEGDASASPGQGLLVLAETENASHPPGPSKPEVAEAITHYQRRWVETFVPADGRSPALTRADRGQLVAMLKAHGPSGWRTLLERYLSDRDRFVVENGHALANMSRRVNGYRSSAKPSSGIREPVQPEYEDLAEKNQRLRG